jgi:SAM-dependent methyltransferase
MPAVAPSCTEVTLFQGGNLDLADLTPSDLERLQWEQERGYAALIRAAPRGSQQRRDAFRDGYDTVTQIFALREGASNGSVRMGLSPRYTSTVLRLLARIARRKPHSRRPPRFFEVGFGCGELLAAVADAGYAVAGIEVSTRMLQQARLRLPERFHDSLFLGDLLTHDLSPAVENGGPAPSSAEYGRAAESGPAADENEGAGPPLSTRGFELVYWNDVFEHLPVDESLDYLRRIHSLLAPGGALLTVTPNWHIRPNDVTGDMLPPRSEARGFHLKEYTLREMDSLLRQAGFSRIETPLFVTRRRSFLIGDGLLQVKCLLEPALESLSFPLTRLLVRGLGLSMTIAWNE